MIVTIGKKHRGKSVESLVLKEPDYIKWMIDQEVTGRLLDIKNEAAHLIDRFDAKPFIKECLRCKQYIATRVSLSESSSDPWPFCDTCDPYSWGAMDGTLTIVSSYREILEHVKYSCKGRKPDYRKAVRLLAQLKGLPKRVTEAKIQAFFKV